MADISIIFPNDGIDYEGEMNAIKKSLSQYPGHKVVASSLGKYCPQNIVAGIVGCVIPESGSDHTSLNEAEYNGRGKPGTDGWNCGEGLIQWTKWKYKIDLIKAYNADNRSTQKLPTTWDTYKRGTPQKNGNRLNAVQDGQHIAGLTLDNQMLFLTKYYKNLIKQLENETNLAVIVAKIYQQKAGSGFYKDISDPILRAYTTAKEKYPNKDGNHYLQSLKVAKEYLNCPVESSSVQPTSGDYTLFINVLSFQKDPIDPTKVTEIKSMNSSNSSSKGLVLGTHMNQK